MFILMICLKFRFIVIPSSFIKEHETENYLFYNLGIDQGIGDELRRSKLPVSSPDNIIPILYGQYDSKSMS